MLLLSLLLTASVYEQPVWNQVRLGMDRATLKQLYPNNKVEAVSGCPANMVATFKKDRLAKLYLVQRGVTPGCRERVLAFLEEKYGQGMAGSGSQLALLPARFLAYSKRIWELNGAKVSFVAFVDRDYSFTVGFLTAN